MTTKFFTCRVCGNSGNAQQYIAKEMMFGSGENFSYLQCLACETLQIETIPENLQQYYQNDYYSFAPVKEHGLKQKILNFGLGLREASYATKKPLQAIFEAIIPPVEHTRLVLDSLAFAEASKEHSILDVGCGNGTILHRLREGGFRKVAGVDPFIQQDIRYRNGLVISKKFLNQMDEHYDLITFHHSFEHVGDPAETLRQARSLLLDTGKILLRIPTVSSLAWDDYKTDWYQLDAPRHLYLFSRKAVAVLAAKVGLNVVGIYDDSTVGQFLVSEQYRRGIAMNAKKSYLVDPKNSIFTEEEIQRFQAKTEEVNVSHRGDQIVVLLALPPGANGP